MNWQNYLVSVSRCDGTTLHITVRGISHRDVEYVCRNGCKRNGGKPLLSITDIIDNIAAGGAA